MKSDRILYILLVILLGPHPVWSFNLEPDEHITEAGDILQYVLPITAGAATLFEEDWEGSKQFARSFGSAALVNTAAKGMIGKLRPNESNYYSYPSGHSMAAFSGAGFLNIRYGPYIGVPAMGLAGFVGYSRVQSDNHFADDVIAGASVGLMFNWIWVTPYEGRYKLFPAMINDEAPGLVFTMPLDSTVSPDGVSGPEEPEPQDFRFGYIWDFGPVWNTRNEVRLPMTGESVDLTQFDSFSEDTMASRLFLTWKVTPEHMFAFEWAPYETRNKETLTDPVTFGGTTFAGSVRYSYMHYEYRLKYGYNFMDDDAGWFRLGASMSYIYNALELVDDSSNFSSSRYEMILPQVYASGGWRFHRKFGLFAEGNWGELSSNSAIDVTAGGLWQINPQWVFSAGYRYYDRLVDEDEWYNRLTQHQPFLSFAYAW